MKFRHSISLGLKHMAQPVLYRFPAVNLQPERQLLWLTSLLATSATEGGIVEVGCAAGGTAALSCRMLARFGDERDYVCIDTFEGFVSDQFDRDTAAGTPAGDRHAFSANSEALVRRILVGLGVHNVRLAKGSISDIADDALPEVISAALVDVDLSVPTFDALTRIHPRLSSRGIVLVDDCPPGSSWKARSGYLQFMEQQKLTPTFVAGMGVVLGPELTVESLLSSQLLTQLSE